jgi:hypothetical protein
LVGSYTIKILRLSRNFKVHYPVHNSPSLYSVLKLTTTVNILKIKEGLAKSVLERLSLVVASYSSDK